MSNITTKYNKIRNLIGDIANEKAGRLVYHLYGQGMTYEEIGKILGVSRQRIEKLWPKGGDLSEKQNY